MFAGRSDTGDKPGTATAIHINSPFYLMLVVSREKNCKNIIHVVHVVPCACINAIGVFLIASAIGCHGKRINHTTPLHPSPPPPHHPLPSLRIRLYYVHVEHRYMHLVHIAGRVVVVVVVHALIWGPQNNVNN